MHISNTLTDDNYVAVGEDKLRELNKIHLSRGKDDKLRVLCGSRIAKTTDYVPSYAVYARRLEQKQSDRQVRKIRCRDRPTKPPKKTKQIWRKKPARASVEEPKPEEIMPRFRTPPCWIFIGSIPIRIDLGT